MSPSAVMIDRTRKTYLKVLDGPKYLHLIPMQASGLCVLKLTPQECEVLGLKAIDYPLARALAHFRSAGERFGMTSQVAGLLERLAAEGEPRELPISKPCVAAERDDLPGPQPAARGKARRSNRPSGRPRRGTAQLGMEQGAEQGALELLLP